MVGLSPCSREMSRPLVALPCGSRSTSSTRFSCAASEAARFTAVVVFPTPPFWLTTASTSAITPPVVRREYHAGPTSGKRAGARSTWNAAAIFFRDAGFRARRPPRIFPPSKTQGDEMKIACVLGQGFEDSEFRVPYDRLKAEGYQVDVIGLKAGEELKGYKGKEKVKAEKGIDQVNADD